ncbi:high-affinity choline transporter 1-like isoform X2 [Acipenser ruthenus]|uniref:high-affinity choline transporter 1-like isoform X2 n=1 Tax=Acipenser ruthenus TaxID=7906 RepID=UPI0027403D9B|nr:high-affinity choline transporter 1-like isoform X2 [Acipenser ruthenus]
MAVNIPGLIAVIVFYILILATGIWASRKAKKEEKKCTGNKSEVAMVGGRNMNLWVGIFTTTATWVGGGYIMGTAEVVYDPAMGLIWSTQPLAYALSLFVGGLFFAKPMRDKNYVTMMDPFQIRYGNTLMSLLSVPVLIAEVAWAANILAALGGTIYVILGIASYQSILMSGGVAILYTLLGGLYSVSYTDVIQLLFIFVSLVFSSVCYQDFYQRVLATSSTAHAQKMCYAAAVFCFFLGVPSMLIGAIAASTDWNQTSYGLPTPYEKGEAGIILPIALQHLCPVYISIAGIGAIAAAVMSSMDSALLAAGSMFAFNIYKNMLRKRASDREVLWVIKISVIFFGVAAMGIAMITTSMYGLGIISGELLYSILFPQTVCILFVPMSNGYGASVGLVVGLTLRLLGGDSFLNFPPVIPYPGCTLVDGVYVQLFPFKTLTMLLSLFSIISVSYLTSLLFKRGLLPKKWDIFYVSKKTDIILKETELSPINNEEDVGGK